MKSVVTQRVAIGLAVVAVVVAVVVGSVAAQDNGGSTDAEDFPVNTITVTGSGNASGTPDMATIDLGVTAQDAEVATAFGEANTTIDAVIEAIVAAGVAREDIRTSGLNIYVQQSFGGPVPMDASVEGGQPANEYVVNNSVSVIVRDISLIEAVIDAAVDAGANNINGLNFGFSDQTQLESDARAAAMADARTRAEQLASLSGVTLGDVIVVTETSGGGLYLPSANMSMDGRGGAVIETGQLSVGVSVQVTFRMVR